MAEIARCEMARTNIYSAAHGGTGPKVRQHNSAVCRWICQGTSPAARRHRQWTGSQRKPAAKSIDEIMPGEPKHDIEIGAARSVADFLYLRTLRNDVRHLMTNDPSHLSRCRQLGFFIAMKLKLKRTQ